MNLSKNRQTFISSTKEEESQFLIHLIQDEQADERILEWGGRLALENNLWETAEKIFSSLLERRFKTEDLVNLSEALLNQLRLKEAEECLLEALNQVTEPCFLLFVVYKYLGQIAVSNKNFLMAEEYYNKAYTLNPHSVSLAFNKALLNLKEKNYLLAEKGFKKVLKNHPEYAKAWFGLALSRRALGKRNWPWLAFKELWIWNLKTKKQPV